MGRATQGVKLINLRRNDIIASVACVLVNEEEDIEPTENEIIENTTNED
jgi:DNA gyrase subunit A